MSAPNVETVSRRSYTSPGLKLIYEPTGERLTITQISKLPGVRVSGRRLMARWHAEGRPRVVTAEMVRPQGPRCAVLRLRHGQDADAARMGARRA